MCECINVYVYVGGQRECFILFSLIVPIVDYNSLANLMTQSVVCLYGVCLYGVGRSERVLIPIDHEDTVHNVTLDVSFR